MAPPSIRSTRDYGTVLIPARRLKVGNTVIAGHRFTYTNPHGILYYLDKVQVGDDIGVYWDNTRYLYKVSEVKVVEPTAVQIEDNTLMRG
jgi:LPXTG-site transpeptidase (sortase) family protein